MKYKKMKFNKILSELDSEEKARAWIWLAKFDGKEFCCPSCSGDKFYQHKKNPEIRECKDCHLYVRIRAKTIFQYSKVPLLIWLKAGVVKMWLNQAFKLNLLLFFLFTFK